MRKDKPVYLILLIIIVSVYTIVFKNLIFSDLHSTDVTTHIRFAQKLLSYSLEHKFYFIPHPLFHIILIGLHFLFGSWEISAVILLIITIVLIYNLQIHYISKELKTNFFSIKCISLSFILLIVSSVYIPPLNHWLSPEYFSVMFTGSGTPNVLHNPTYYLVKVFVLPLIYLALKLINSYQTITKKDLIIFTLLLSASILAKPNFALSFIPVFTLLFAFKSFWEKNSIGNIFKTLILALLLPVIILFLQFYVSYVAGPRDSVVSVCNFCVWLNWSKIPALSVLLGTAFPLYMFLIKFSRNLKETKYQFAWLNFIFALLFAGFFYETGYRLLAGNFFWGYNLALYILFYVSVIDFFRLLSDNYKIRNYSLVTIGAAILLMMHLAGGLYHFSKYMH